ncbi:MAG: methylmalonyl-CoA carboxyltransferase [Actinomycetia bacterium]|nr:methylmalonyl-CoA carboxyltransferase [Actinomycetes bacterium]
MSWEPEVQELRRRRQLAAEMGGPERVARHRAQGRLTVRERIAALLDPGSFHEIGGLAGQATYENGELVAFRPANFVFGTGTIGGRKVVVAGDDFTVRGGAADGSVRGKQEYAERLAFTYRIPIVRLVDGSGGGGSVRTLETAGHTYVPVNPAWDAVVANLGMVPVVSACLGSVAGLGAARVVASHFSVMVAGTSQLFVAGPPVVKYGTGEDLDKESLGGVQVHRHSGAVDNIAATEAEAFAQIRRFLSYLPSHVFELPPVVPAEDDPERREEALPAFIPRNRRQPYRIRELLALVFDRDSLFELGRTHGGSVVTALARLDGRPVGVVASDPYVAGGALTAEASRKLERFVDLCDTFHLPLVALVDQPGLAIGRRAEEKATIRWGTRAIVAVYQARVPMAAVVVRRMFGVGGAGMVNQHALTRRFAWPSADWGSLPVEGGLEAAYRRELEASRDPSATRAEILARLDAVRSPFRTAEVFGIEEIIDPRDTRPLLCEWVRDVWPALAGTLGPPGRAMRP